MCAQYSKSSPRPSAAASSDDVVRPEPAEEHHALRARDRGDGVDLHGAERADDLGDRRRRACRRGAAPRRRAAAPPRAESSISRTNALEPDEAAEPVEGAVERVVERPDGADAGLAVERPDDELAASRAPT